jgi:hypothetical protein
MSNDGKQAVFIGTFMETGDAVALCEDCLPAFTATVTADMFGVDGAQLLEWLKANQGDEAPADVSEVAEVAAPPAMMRPPASDVDPTAGGSVPSSESDGDETQPAGQESPPAEPEHATAGE